MAKKYKDQWEIASFSEPDKWYKVSETMEGGWQCSCPRWIFGKPRHDCKHIDMVQAGRSQYHALQASPNVAAKAKSLRTSGARVEMGLDGWTMCQAKSLRTSGARVEMDLDGWTMRQARALGTAEVKVARPGARKSREL